MTLVPARARSVARWRGLKVYDGVICKRCGNQRKYVVNANCVDCDRAKHADPRNAEHANLYQRARRKNRARSAEERAKDCARTKRWRIAHPYAAITAKAQMRRDKALARAEEQAAVRANTVTLMYYQQEWK